MLKSCLEPSWYWIIGVGHELGHFRFWICIKLRQINLLSPWSWVSMVLFPASICWTWWVIKFPRAPCSVKESLVCYSFKTFQMLKSRRNCYQVLGYFTLLPDFFLPPIDQCHWDSSPSSLCLATFVLFDWLWLVASVDLLLDKNTASWWLMLI